MKDEALLTAHKTFDKKELFNEIKLTDAAKNTLSNAIMEAMFPDFPQQRLAMERVRSALLLTIEEPLTKLVDYIIEAQHDLYEEIKDLRNELTSSKEQVSKVKSEVTKAPASLDVAEVEDGEDTRQRYENRTMRQHMSPAEIREFIFKEFARQGGPTTTGASAIRKIPGLNYYLYTAKPNKRLWTGWSHFLEDYEEWQHSESR